MRAYSKPYLDEYKKIRKNQNYDFVRSCLKKYCEKMDKKMSIQTIFNHLNKFVDVSDPDVSLPNIIHCIQTAEQIRKDGWPRWFQLVGFIHDIGKILFVKGCDEDGTSIKEQWALVGDTFITGMPIPKDEFSQFNHLNKDHQNPSKYENHQGLDKCLCSFGHDEFLYHILNRNKNKLPKKAYFIIRYHSLYLLHTHNQYYELLNEKDVGNLGWLKLFNKYDLYTKKNEVYHPKKLENLKKYYFDLFKEFFGGYTIYV